MQIDDIPQYRVFFLNDKIGKSKNWKSTSGCSVTFNVTRLERNKFSMME